jgi:hypothetical protein
MVSDVIVVKQPIEPAAGTYYTILEAEARHSSKRSTMMAGPQSTGCHVNAVCAECVDAFQLLVAAYTVTMCHVCLSRRSQTRLPSAEQTRLCQPTMYSFTNLVNVLDQPLMRLQTTAATCSAPAPA